MIGTSLPELMEFGGWKSFDTVLRYANLAPEHLSAAAQRSERASGVVGAECDKGDGGAIALPIARSHPWIGSLFVNRNDCPRGALLETILRFVEEDLAGTDR